MTFLDSSKSISFIDPPTIRNIVMHKIIAPNENIPGHIKIEGSVEIKAIIIETSTVRSQKMSRIPPKTDGFSNLATAPSNTSKKKDITINIIEHVIKPKLHDENPLNIIERALNNPITNPITVS